jgi:RNA polymerase sigma-70 factor, ECF subfamily
MTESLASFDDSALIKGALAGRVECFTVLMSRHLGAVKRRVVPMMQNAADVEDLLQEVALKVWQHVSTFRSESSFRTWMTGIAINEVLQSYRQSRRRPVCWEFIDHDACACPAESPYHLLAQAERDRAVRAAIATLPEKYRQILILRNFELLSTRDTAEYLQLPVPTVKSRLFRARLRLLNALQRFGTTGNAQTSPHTAVHGEHQC